MPQVIEIGSNTALGAIKAIPELLAIDKEIDRPYQLNPTIYNSMAWSRRLELPWVIGQMGPFEGLSILDVGSGVSPLPIYLSRKQAKVVSVDMDIERGLPVGCADRVRAALPHLPFRDDSFDVVSCISVFEHVNVGIPECFAELCRVARKQVILTFDIALSPFAPYGLSAVELKAFAKMLGIRLAFPRDILTPTVSEHGKFAGQIGLCMLRVDKTTGEWPTLSLGKTQRLIARMHRILQEHLSHPRRIYRELRKILAGDGRLSRLNV